MACLAVRKLRCRQWSSATHLEHLDEGNREVQVGLVTADQTQTEEYANGNDGAEVDAAVHRHLLARVQDTGEASEGLGHDGRKGQMPSGQEDGCEVLDMVNFCVDSKDNVRNPVREKKLAAIRLSASEG